MPFKELPNAAPRHVEKVVRVIVFRLKKRDHAVQCSTRLQDANKLLAATKGIAHMLEDV